MPLSGKWIHTDSQKRWNDAKASVIASTDIVELIGQTVALKRRGKDFIGLCPFHQEKTPSFNVSPSKHFFHCFGCKAHGNAIDFVMKLDRVEFAEAVRRLGGGRPIVHRAAPPPPVKVPPAEPTRKDLPMLAERFQTAMHPDRLDQGARDLGVSVESLDRLHVGDAGVQYCFECERRCAAWSFPMRDAHGIVCGIRLRFPECKHKSAIGGGINGIFMPSDIALGSRLFVCEGPTDTAAMLDLGLPTIGRACARGDRFTTLLCDFLKLRAITELVIVGDGDATGVDSAKELAGRARLYCPRIKIIMPPPDIKDAREWKRRGAVAADIEQLVAAAGIVTLIIKSNRKLEGASHP